MTPLTILETVMGASSQSTHSVVGDSATSPLPIGCAQMTWTNMPGEAPNDDLILAEIARAGYDGTPLPAARKRPFADSIADDRRFGLRVAPGYLGGSMWKPEERERLVMEAHAYAEALQGVGCHEIYIAAGGPYTARSGRTRREASGHVRPEDGLRDDELTELASTANVIGRATLTHGVRSCFHNHVGTVIETRDEFERLMTRLDPTTVFLGPDTGHLAWAGDDPVAFCRDHAERILTIHLKDINPVVAAAARAGEWDYDRAKHGGVFAELGEGCVDFPAIMDALTAAGFASWLVVETDLTQKPSAYESAAISRAYLHTIGY